MKKMYATDLVISGTPAQVSKLLQLDQAAPEAWQRLDLPAMVRHQMSAPLEFDLGSVKLSQAEQKPVTESLAEASRANLRTFGDLFQSHRPPLKLLKLSQQFFKENVTHSPKGSPEEQVAYLFYLLSIVIARLRHHVKNSKLSDQELLNAIQCTINRPWVDVQIRKWLVEGRNQMAQDSSR